MQTLTLTIGERVAGLTLLRTYATNLPFDGVRLALRTADKLAVESDADRAAYGYRKDERGIHWDEQVAHPVELSDEQYDFLVSCARRHDAEKKFSLADGSGMVTLVSKLFKLPA